MEAKKSNIKRKEEEETKTAVNDQRNLSPRLEEPVSEDRRFKPTHQMMSDEPKTANHQEVQLHQKSEAEPWNHHLKKSDVFQSVRAVRTLRKGCNHQTMEAQKSNQMRK